MNICELIPQPPHCETFKRDRVRFIPDTSGCYVLSTFARSVLYVGLTDNLRRRMVAHLDSPGKNSVTKLGRATLFHWIECLETNKIERTWMNIHISHEGLLPPLNGVYSATHT